MILVDAMLLRNPGVPGDPAGDQRGLRDRCQGKGVLSVLRIRVRIRLRDFSATRIL